MKFAGLDIADMSRQPLKRLAEIFRPWAEGTAKGWKKLEAEHPEKAMVACRIAKDLEARLEVLIDLGLGYLSLERSTPTLSPGELQRLRLGTQVHSNLFGVVYVLDEPSAGLHPKDTEALLRALDRLKARATRSSWWSTSWTSCATRTGSWTWGRTRGEHGGRGAVQRAGRGAAGGEGVAHPAVPVRRDRRRRGGSRASRRAGSGSRASPGTTCTTSTSPSRSACSRR